jgi:hypothetical protein
MCRLDKPFQFENVKTFGWRSGQSPHRPSPEHGGFHRGAGFVTGV